MKKILIWLLSTILSVGALTATGFYVVPKFITKKPTKYVEALDKIFAWVGQNWIWLVVLLAVILLTILILYIVFEIQKKQR